MTGSIPVLANMKNISDSRWETYKRITSSIINGDMMQYKAQSELYQVLMNLQAECVIEDDPIVYEYAIKACKYARQMAFYMVSNAGSDEAANAYYELYWKFMLFEAQHHQVDSGLIYLEKNRQPKDRFYEPRRKVFMKHGIIQAFQDLIDDKIDFMAVSLPPGTGKLLADDTPVLTTKGWKRHGDLAVGDYVYGMDGKPKEVLHVFPKDYADYEVEFTNGEKICCHGNHEWLVHNRHKQQVMIMDTKSMYEDEIDHGEPGKRGHRYMFMLPGHEPFDGEDIELPVKPYTLGVWLGDGRNVSPDICGATEDYPIVEGILEDGYEISWTTTHKITGVKYYGFRGLRKGLQALGMCYSHKRVEKHIPDIYLTASMKQRLALLAGLLDTDGTARRKENKYTYSTTDDKLKDSFVALVSTFGWRCCVILTEPHTSSFGIEGRKPCWTISFSPTIPIPCRLERKRLPNLSKQRRVGIKSIKRIEPKQGNCIQVEGGMYCVGRQMIPTHNSTIEIFALSLVGGWYPNDFNLSSAHSSILTRSLYDGILEILNDPVEYTWHEIFPSATIQGTNAKETTINLDRPGRFKTWTMRSIDGSLTGATRANRFLTADDLVSGIEEALNKNRLESLWSKVTNDLFSRMLDGCKQLFFATRWSTADPIGRMYDMYHTNPRARFIAVPALDENGESNFMYDVNGFSKEYFLMQQRAMDEISFNALYQQKPIEREGLLFPPSKLRRFFRDKHEVPEEMQVFTVLPNRDPDAIWAVCDTKDKGSDFQSMPIAYQYGEDFYILDVVFDDTADYDILDRKTADMLIYHQPQLARFESNSAGGRVADNITKMIKGQCRTQIETKYTTANKETKILVNSDWIIKHCLFLDPACYAPNTDYGKFIGNICSYTTRAKVPHDDAPDSMAQLSEFIADRLGRNRNTEFINSPF